MSDTLLPCPFCGGEATLIESCAWFWGQCLGCKSVCGGQAETEQQAIFDWNSRAELATLKQQASRLDAAEKLVERLAKQLSLNHNWHLQYEEDGEYSDTSTLYEKNTEALAEAAKWREGK